ncbi:MAG: NAD(P)H-dependent oxidoreductase [Bdellovibrionales bacterium]|nr:NAD(P)H-dependent oxidoreductase [Bdellovibrionales bacterium]
MIEIISGTDRPNSRTLTVAKHLLDLYRGLKADVNLIDLNQLNLADLASGEYYKGPGESYKNAVARVTEAQGIVLVVPEYNGSYPGILKLFIDYWRYPETFEHRPIAMVGLGTRWGGLRPVEHLQQALGYRNAYVYPNRVFLSHIKELLKDGSLKDQSLLDLLDVQARGFMKYIHALEQQHMDANSIRKNKPS